MKWLLVELAAKNKFRLDHQRYCIDKGQFNYSIDYIIFKNKRSFQKNMHVGALNWEVYFYHKHFLGLSPRPDKTQNTVKPFEANLYTVVKNKTQEIVYVQDGI